MIFAFYHEATYRGDRTPITLVCNEYYCKGKSLRWLVSSLFDNPALVAGKIPSLSHGYPEFVVVFAKKLPS